MTKILITLFLLASCIGTILANNIQITNVSYDNDNNQVTFNISWENSWRSGTDYHDAVWVFKKKTKKEVLQSKYRKLMAKCHRLSSINRKKSDQLFYEAHTVLKMIESLG